MSEPPAPPDPSETEAIARLLAGDPKGFEFLVHRYLRPAFAVAYRLLGHREDAEDVVQEAFLAALTNIGSFDPTRRFGPWLYRIVWTRGLNLRKSRSRRAAEPLKPERHASPGGGPAARAEQGEVRARVAEALAQLPERQRQVVQLFDLDGFSGAEIAAMLGLAPGTVRWHLHEGRRTLRTLLAPLEEAFDER